MINQTNAQGWVDTHLYPFQNKYIQLSSGKMHYIDEGSGEIILFVHGTPTWSFLYRDFIKALSKTYRCIAIDHIGFGLSEKPKLFPGTPELHAKNLSEFIHKINLQNITLVLHDFGGPIGLKAAIDNSDRIKSITLFNTWLWATKNDKSVQKIDKTINRWIGKFLYLKMNVSPKYLLKRGFSDKKKLSRGVHEQYIKPFPDKDSRYSLLNLAKSLLGASNWYQNQWEQLELLLDKRWLIIWGTNDAFLKMNYLKKWKDRLPKAKIIEIPCGHFVQEEKAEDSINAIREFMEP